VRPEPCSFCGQPTTANDLIKETASGARFQQHMSICRLCINEWSGRLGGGLTDAQGAAENYHEAWQDAAVYWKEKVAALECGLERALIDLSVSETIRQLESATLVQVCHVLRRERDELQVRLDREPRVSAAIRKDRDEALNHIKKLEAQLDDNIHRISDLSEARVKVQVKWGADVDRLNTMLESVVDIMQGASRGSVVREELEALVNRIEADLQRNPRQ
jgi:hypothetical protein